MELLELHRRKTAEAVAEAVAEEVAELPCGLRLGESEREMKEERYACRLEGGGCSVECALLIT